MAKPSKDEILKDLIEFFLEEYDNNDLDVCAWLVQGDWDADEFIGAVRDLKSQMA